MKRFLWCIALILLTAGVLAAQVKIKGTIYDSFGKKVQFGNVTVNSIIAQKAGQLPNYFKGDGKFEAELPNGGWYLINFSAPNHSGLSKKIFMENGNGDLIITVHLASYEYAENLDNVALMGEWNNFNLETAEPMVKLPDGTFLFEKDFNGTNVRYQLVNAEKNGRTINGTQSDSYEYDNDGDFRSITSVKGNKLRIIFNPAGVVRGSGKASVEFDSGHSYLNYLAEIDRWNSEISDSVNAEYKKYTNAGKDPRSFRYHPDMTKYVKYYSGLLNDKKINYSIRQYAALNIISTGIIYYLEMEAQILETIIVLLPFESEIWQIDPHATFSFKNLVFNYEFNKLNSSITDRWEKNPSPLVRAFGLIQKLMALRNIYDAPSREKYIAVYQELTSKYKNLDSRVDGYIEEYNPEKQLRPGMTVPDFSVKLLGSEEVITRKKMLGKYYLIDFWATWCGPCVEEMDNLHKVYDKYKDKNFTILSLSLDNKVEDIAAFREKKYKMPWLNAFLENSFLNQIVKDFNVSAIPRPILIGPDGTILDLDNLWSKMLEPTIGKYIK